MFERLISLIGKDKFNKLQKVNVLIIGVGGVGGYALEALINIEAKSIFITKDNFKTIFDKKYDYVIDACDDMDIKYLLIKNSNKYKLLSSMGTANKFDPSKFQITTIDKTSNDPIARILRKRVKDDHIRNKFKVVSSTETPHQKGVLGTNSYIPGIAGLLCASYVVNDILKK